MTETERTTDKTRRLLAAATPGPWQAETKTSWGYDSSYGVIAIRGKDKWPVFSTPCCQEANAELAAHLRNVAEAYVRVVEVMRKAMEGNGPEEAITILASEGIDALDALDTAGGDDA